MARRRASRWPRALRPDFDPPGVRVGSFLLRPQWAEGLGYDNNVFGSSDGGRGSWLVGTHPSLLVGSDWSRHSLGGYVGVDDLRYLDQPRQSQTNWTAAVGGALSVGRDQLTVSVAHLGLHQARTELDALPSDTPVAYRVDDIRVGYTIALNRLSVTPSVAFSAFRYDATTIRDVPASQAYRDRDVVQGAVTTRYELSPQPQSAAGDAGTERTLRRAAARRADARFQRLSGAGGNRATMPMRCGGIACCWDGRCGRSRPRGTARIRRRWRRRR